MNEGHVAGTVTVPCNTGVAPDSYHNIPLPAGGWITVYVDHCRVALVPSVHEADASAYLEAQGLLLVGPQSREQESEQRPEPAKLAEQGEEGGQ